MDFRKLESNKMKVNASKINLVSFVKEVVDHFKEDWTSNKKVDN